MSDSGMAGAGSRRSPDEVDAADAHTSRKPGVTRPTSRRRTARLEAHEAVAKVLAPLSFSGWLALHDRVGPTGDNIDHIVIGPGSVIVLDAKAWNGRLEERNGKLLNGGWSQTKAVTHLATQRRAVLDAVRGTVGGDGPVDMALVVTTQERFGPLTVGDTIVLGLGHLADAIESTRSSHEPETVDRLFSTLSEAFPPAGTVTPASTGLHHVDGLELGDLFNRANRFLYLTTTRHGGEHHMQLRDEDGERFGRKDLRTGEVHLDHEDDPIVEHLLRTATQTGLQLRAEDLPEVPIVIPGRRLLALAGRLHTSVVIGNRWKGRNQDRLYGTLASPTEGVFELGYVDLTTGWVTPTSRGPLSRDRGPAERYLALLRDRCPFAYGPDESLPVAPPQLERIGGPGGTATDDTSSAGADESEDTEIELRDHRAPTSDGEFRPKPPEPKQFDLPGS
ncbi:MAG: NERD domain-containing protein [Actinomycetota bacterium]|nr:NERD domain-containing protein [Actinomycetota bacterium]